MMKSNESIEKLLYDDIIIGLLLSDANLEKTKPTWNSRFRMKQTMIHKELVFATEKHLKKLGFRTNIYYDKYNKLEVYTGSVGLSSDEIFRSF